jgi:hypothetical protein
MVSTTAPLSGRLISTSMTVRHPVTGKAENLVAVPHAEGWNSRVSKSVALHTETWPCRISSCG